MKRLDTGALVKDYEGPEEIEQAVQLGLQEVISEDPRFLAQAAPPMAEEFPQGSRIIFLGEHAYGVAAQVSSTTDDSLTIIIAVSPSFDVTISGVEAPMSSSSRARIKRTSNSPTSSSLAYHCDTINRTTRPV